MTQDIFLQLSGIAGESQDANHRDNIDVLSWEWQVYQAAALHGGNGGGAGKSSVNDLIIEHYTDRASPNLLKYCLTGKPSATLVIRKAGGKLDIQRRHIRQMDAVFKRRLNNHFSQW